MQALFGKKSPVKARMVRWNNVPRLVVSFQTCSPALIWHLDLDKNPNVTLSLREVDGEWELGYTPAQGAFISVVRMDDREDAEAAYGLIEKTLLCGLHDVSFGHIMKNFFLFLILLAFVWFLGSFMTSSASHKKEEQAKPAVTSEKEIALPQDPSEMRNGVPLNADDVLPKDTQ